MFYEKCSAEFNISAQHVTEIELEHAFAVDGDVSKVVLFCSVFVFCFCF